MEEYKDIIVSINPKWENIGDAWNAILPTKEDLILQMNTIFYSEFVINLGSSMVFDFVSFKKPCAFINYDVVNKEFPNWSVRKIYKFVHFRSMPTKNSVIWLNSPEEIESIIESLLNSNDTKIVHDAQKWFEIINQHPPELASERIWTAIETIIKK